MHWVWRTAIAVGVGTVVEVTAYLILQQVTVGPMRPRPVVDAVILALLLTLPQITCLLVYTHLTFKYGPYEGLERETRCRRCGYILRGITERKCPDCGEHI